MKIVMPESVRLRLTRLENILTAAQMTLEDIKAEFCQCPDVKCAECDCQECK